ncbi:MAG: fibrobacter succinogenes major paralogous domain-containing protein, partial [Candidatus Cloacimonetes bacterium]|nr:fibrobacter succinogenes major paralogous domain-containing protein [Candidatus Cloacimonadota bacterium]
MSRKSSFLYSIIFILFSLNFGCKETISLDSGNATVTDIDGNVYQTLVLGDQEWMAENLKVTHYRNGDPIPNVTTNSTWAGLSTNAYCYYDNDPANGDTYGALYNWYAVDDARGLAPEGWHVPTDAEIMELEMYLGMSQQQANSTGYRGTNEGSKLAGGYDLWQNGALRNDPEFGSSGFSFLPGG